MLGSQTEVAKLTYEDYRQLPDDGKRYEIVEGELYVTPSPSTRHQRVVGELFLQLAQFVREKRLGQVFVAPLDVVLSEYTVVQPDLIFVSEAHRERVREDGVYGAPDLVVEVVSESTRDRDAGLKKRLYLRSGVVEYWLVDPEEGALTIVRADSERTYRGGKIRLVDSLLRGLELDLATLFAG